MKKVLGLLVLLAFGASLSTQAQVIVDAMPTISVMDPAPPSVRRRHGGGSIESLTVINCFFERQNEVLLADLVVNMTVPGLAALPAELTPGVIPAGTRVNSFFAHHDPEGGVFHLLYGQITFDRPIIGVICQRIELVKSHPVLGLPTVLYENVLKQRPSLELFGYVAESEKNPYGIYEDGVILSADMRTIWWRTRTTGQDDIRIITAGDPD